MFSYDITHNSNNLYLVGTVCEFVVITNNALEHMYIYYYQTLVYNFSNIQFAQFV